MDSRARLTLILALATSLVTVPGASRHVRAAECSGSWASMVRFDGEANALEAAGEMAFGISGVEWEAEVRTAFDLEAWSKLEMELAVERPGVEVESTLTFDPSRIRLKKWSTDASVESEGWTFSCGVDLYANHGWIDLRVQGDLGTCEIDIKARLGASTSFSFDFYRVDVDVSFAVRDVSVAVASRLTAKKRFEWIDVEIVLRPLASVPELELQVDARRTPDGLQLDVEPSLDVLSGSECASVSVEWYAELASSEPIEVEGLRVVGAVTEAVWRAGWAELRTSFDPAWNKKVVGRTEYRRGVGLGYEALGPCEREASIEAWGFSADPSRGFGWDRLDLTVAVRPVASWEITVATSLVPGSTASLALGLDLEW